MVCALLGLRIVAVDVVIVMIDVVESVDVEPVSLVDQYHDPIACVYPLVESVVIWVKVDLVGEYCWVVVVVVIHYQHHLAQFDIVVAQ